MTRVLQGFIQFYLPPNTSHTCFYSQPHSITTLWPALTWPEWLVRLHRELNPIQSPIPVLTGPSIK